LSPNRTAVRVCLLSSSHPVDYSRFLDRESAALAAGGFEVTFVGLAAEGVVKDVPGVKVVPVRRGPAGGKLSLLCRIAKAAVAEHADVYHCLDPWTLAIGLGLRNGRSGVKVVYESSEWFPQTYLDRKELPAPARRVAWLLVVLLEHAACKRAETILETNRTRSGRFVRRGRTPVLVENYPPAELLPEPSSELRPWIAYTGLVSRPRGFDRLLQALFLVRTRFPDVELHVVGAFDPRNDIEVWARRFIHENGLERNVVLHGTMPYRAMFDLLGKCLVGAILLQPGRGNDFTGLPNKLFEFMGSGLAIVASDFPEMARVVLDAGSGWLVDPTNVESIASALTDVLTSQDASRDRGRAGRRMVLARYNWQAAAGRLLDEYRRITHEAVGS
jgi:glycosyltransferase involved in cell wall biosynthesis